MTSRTADVLGRINVNPLRPRAQIEPLEQRTLLSISLAADLAPGDHGSWPGQFVTLGNTAYFFAPGNYGDGSIRSAELWKTDGTPAGTSIVKDGLPADGRYNAGPRDLTQAGGHLYFAAQGGMWTSDGTSDGTHFLKALGDGSGNVGTMSEFRGTTYFAAYDADGPGLWTTDGTDKGTARVPGLPAFTRVGEPFVSGSHLYFSASDATGVGIWSLSDTTPGATKLRNLTVLELGDVDGTLYFSTIPQAGAGSELWKSDGTPDGTVRIKVFPPTPLTSAPHELTNFGGELFFAAAGRVNAIGEAINGLWKSDGTEAGTVEVKGIVGQSRYGLAPYKLTVFEDSLVYFGYDSETGRELWKSDGTSDGTVIVAETRPGKSSGSGEEFGFHRVGNELYFVADDGLHGKELWKTDLSQAGTKLVIDLNPGSDGGLIPATLAFDVRHAAIPVGNRLVFVASDKPGDVEPWASDGTAEGTVRLANINTTPYDSEIRWSMPFGNLALFGATGLIYRSDGTPQGTTLLSRRVTSSYLYQYPGQAVVGGFAIFPGSDQSDHGKMKFFRSDGTSEGTFPLLDSVDPSYLSIVVSGGFAYFIGKDASHGAAIWRTDGQDTSLVKDISPEGEGQINFNGGALAAVGDTVYFKSSYGELWKTDGTPTGKVLVRDLGVDRQHHAQFSKFAAVGSKLFFEAPLGEGPLSLWVSDGTSQGTVPLPANLAHGSVTGFNGIAYFASTGASGAIGLYRSDGTDDGTRLVKEIDPDNLTVFGNKLYFTSGGGVWITDGTAEGTLPLAEFGDAGTPASLTAGSDALYFTADDGIHGRELWQSGGTPASTRLVEDFIPGIEGSNPEYLTAAGNTLVFAATGPAFGRELWKIPLPQVSGVAVSSTAWSKDFFNSLHEVNLGEHGYSLTAGQSTPLPWTNLNQIAVRFNIDVGANPSTLSVIDGNGDAQDATLRSYDVATYTATWTIPKAMKPGQIKLSLGSFKWSANLIAGDADRNGVVGASDLVRVRNRIGLSASAGGSGNTTYTVFDDVNGSGGIDATDLVLVRNRIGSHLLVSTSVAGLVRETSPLRRDRNLALPQ